MKLVSTLVICTSLTISPLAAQTIPYNPAVRAAPPTFKAIPPAPSTAEAVARKKALTVGAILILGWIAYMANKGRANASDDRPTNWTGHRQSDVIEFYQEREPAPIPVPPPAPAISPFYDVSKGVGG